MTDLVQSLILARIGLAGWRERIASSFVIVVGMACVVGVLASTLAMRAGMLRMLDATSDPALAIVLSAKSPTEFGEIPPTWIGTILAAPGIERQRSGDALADAEIDLIAHLSSRGDWQSISVEGIGATGIDLRPAFRMIEGRMFRSGLHELVVGQSAARVHGLSIGDKVPMPGGDEWPVVGVFSSGQDLLESRLVTDAKTLMASAHRLNYGSLLVRLKNPESFDAFSRWLAANPTLEVTAERQVDYYVRTGGGWLSYLEAFAYFVTAIISIGALFGSVNLLYAVVSARRLEIATLRAVGYRALPVAASVVAEAVVLSVIGALVGLSVSWLLFDGRDMVTLLGIFRLFVSPRVAAVGLGWVILLALVGALPPAIRAAHLPVADALRAT